MQSLDLVIPGLAPLLQSADRDGASLGFELSGVFDAGFGDAGAEVVAFFDGRLYVTNSAADQIDVFDIATGTLAFSIDLSTIPGYDGVNSVDVTADGIAVAIDIANLVDPSLGANGVVARYALDGTAIDTIEVGNLPDQLVYSKDGTKIFVANEGEPEDGEDPKGSISIVDVATGTANTFFFDQFDAEVDALRDAGVRIFPGLLPSTDFEPEYIAEGPDGMLYVSLQEANAIAVFDLATETFEKIIPLGVVDHSQPGFGIDPSDRDDAIDIREVPVFGLRMPDAIAVTEIGGETFIVTANEGDDRGENERIKDIVLDPIAFPNAAELQADEALGRLNVSTIDGDTDGDGDFDELYAYGSRSFTIFDADGNVVFDSGDDFEQIIAATRVANAFNNDDFPSDDPGVVDENRSDNKGPEPEAVAIGRIGDVTLAFIGLERDGGIMVYDISDPANATFVDYIDARADGNISPEIIEFIPAAESVSGVDQIAVAFEVSGTTALYDIELGKTIDGTGRGDEIAGTIGDDVITGGNGKDVINGRGGDDTIDGGNGKDTIEGGAGDDKIMGGRGKDVLSGGLGNDVLVGGNGPDRFVFAPGGGEDKIVDLDRPDVIDLSATGLGFEDLSITEIDSRVYEVVYGEGDVITVHLGRGNRELDAGDFVF